MRNEFTAIYLRDEGWYVGSCAELPGANTQGKTLAECRENLKDAILLILESWREESLNDSAAEAIHERIVVETPIRKVTTRRPVGGKRRSN